MTMQRIPVDMGRLENLLCMSGPEARVNPETGEVRTDRRTGLPTFVVGVAVKVAGSRKAYVLDVQVSGEPVGVVEGAPVRVFDLEAVPWEIDGRNGVSYQASAVTAVTAVTVAGASSGPGGSLPGTTDTGRGAAKGGEGS